MKNSTIDNFNLYDQIKQLRTQTLSAQVTRALEVKAQRGEYPGKPPIGYLNNTNTKQIVPDPKTWDTIKTTLEQYATGKHTIGWITLFLNEHLPTVQHCDRQPLTKSQVSTILHNPFYSGKFKFRGKTYQGKHKPMISEAIFNKIQEHLNEQA